MEISIDYRMLIERAKQRSGMTLAQMAEEMGVSKARVSEWRNGRFEPGVEEVAYFADKAEVPILETVMTLKPRMASVWRHAMEQAQQKC